MDAEAYADMLPWLVFLAIDRKSGLGVAWAGAGALICSAGLVAWSYWRGRYALLPRVAVALFAVCLVSGLVFQSWNEQVSLPRALVVATLSALAFGSLPFKPLSETYTWPLVAPSFRDDPRFGKVNVEITLAWGVGSLAVAVASGTTALLSGAVAFTFLDWVTPLVLAAGTILWATRRWELFRLAVDSFAIGHDSSEPVVLGDVPRRRAFRAAMGRTLPRALPVELVASDARSRELDGVADPPGKAVIRRLPLGGRNA